MTEDAGELLACPFCGGAGKVTGVRDGRKAYCVTCHASAPPEYHGKDGWNGAERRAVAAWNRRVVSAPLGEPGGEGFGALRPSASVPTEGHDAAAVVWVVTGSVGEYSDRSEWPARAFEAEADAQAFVERMDALGRDWWGKWSADRYSYPANPARAADEEAIRAVEAGWGHDYTGPATYTAGPVAYVPAQQEQANDRR